MKTIKNWIVIMVAAMLSLTLASPAMAKGKKTKADAAGKSGKHESKFKKRDANHDGVITFDEFKAYHDAHQSAKNKAGKTGKKAGKAGKKAGKKGKGNKPHMTLQERFDRRDVNHDGKITKKEWKETKKKKGNKAGKGGKKHKK